MSARDAMGYLRIFGVVYAGILLILLPTGFDRPIVTILLGGVFATLSVAVGLLAVTIRKFIDKRREDRR